MERLTGAALDAYRLASSARLLVRRREHVLPPHGAGRGTHVTAVSRLPRDLADAVANALEPLRAAAPDHYFYPPETMHLTIRNLDGLPDEALAAAAAVLREMPPLRLDLRGLNVSAHTVLVQALPLDGSLRSTRRRLDDAARGSRTRRPRLLWDFAHVNVVRFQGPVTFALLAEVLCLRSVPLGTLVVDEAEIVETDRLLSTAGTRTLERIVLDAG